MNRRRLVKAWMLLLLTLAGIWLLNRWLAPHATSTTRNCKPRRILDGDTIRATCAGNSLTIRLYCSDAPEMDQRPWGRASRNHLRALIPRNIPLTLLVRDTDAYGRAVGELITPSGVNINRQQIRSGHAVVYRKYCSRIFDNDYYDAEQAAREKRSGLWEKPGLQQTPWIFRHH